MQQLVSEEQAVEETVHNAADRTAERTASATDTEPVEGASGAGALREEEGRGGRDGRAAPRRSGRLKRVSGAAGITGDIATGDRRTAAGGGREAGRVGASNRVAANAVATAARPSGPRIVRVGEARIDDLRAHDARMESEAVERGTRRRNEGEQGRMQDAQGHDLDRSAGGPWRAGRSG